VKGLTDLMLAGGSRRTWATRTTSVPIRAEGFPRFLRAVVHGHAEWPAQFRPESQRLERVEFDGEPIALGLCT
jgi:hypothetical protein